MYTNPQIPNQRILSDSLPIGNPISVNDIYNCNQQTLTLIASLLGETLGISNSDFYILSGFNLVYPLQLSGQQYYGPGIFYCKGGIYCTTANFRGGNYLRLLTTPTLQLPFNDTTSHYTYTIYSAIQQSGSGDTPLINDNNQGSYKIDSYKLNLATLQSQINILSATISPIITNWLATEEDWNDVTTLGGFTNNFADSPDSEAYKLSYKLDVQNRLHLRGSVCNNSGIKTGFGEKITVNPLPTKYIPAKTMVVPIVAGDLNFIAGMFTIYGANETTPGTMIVTLKASDYAQGDPITIGEIICSLD
jgi:hypothetical protein